MVAAAQLTYFGAIAIVPWLLLACWSASWVDGWGVRLLRLQEVVPDAMGARGPFRELVRAGTDLGVAGALVTLVPATFYGEGARRGCLALLPPPHPDRLTGWRARLSMLPLLLVVPPVAIVVAGLSPVLLDLAWPARVVVSFTITWLALTGPLAWVFRHVTTERLPWSSSVLGALATSSFLAGFLQGFVLFLTIPVDLGIPFGGLHLVGGVVATGFWLFLLHLVLLVGWLVTVDLDSALRERGRTG